jgi:hypothetical protein
LKEKGEAMLRIMKLIKKRENKNLLISNLSRIEKVLKGNKS